MSEEPQARRGGAGRWLLAAAGVAGLYALWRWRGGSTAPAGAMDSEPELVPLVFARPLEPVHAAALQAGAALPGWQIAGAAEPLSVVIQPQSPGLPGTVVVHFTPLMDGRLTKVHVAAAAPEQVGASVEIVRAFQTRLRALLSAEGESHVE